MQRKLIRTDKVVTLENFGLYELMLMSEYYDTKPDEPIYCLFVNVDGDYVLYGGYVHVADAAYDTAKFLRMDMDCKLYVVRVGIEKSEVEHLRC